MTSYRRGETNSDVMACKGAPTIEEYSGADMVECIECGMCVRHDLTEHSFFGFAAGCTKTNSDEVTRAACLGEGRQMRSAP